MSQCVPQSIRGRPAPHHQPQRTPHQASSLRVTVPLRGFGNDPGPSPDPISILSREVSGTTHGGLGWLTNWPLAQSGNLGPDLLPKLPSLTPPTLQPSTSKNSKFHPANLLRLGLARPANSMGLDWSVSWAFLTTTTTAAVIIMNLLLLPETPLFAFKPPDDPVGKENFAPGLRWGQW